MNIKEYLQDKNVKQIKHDIEIKLINLLDDYRRNAWNILEDEFTWESEPSVQERLDSISGMIETIPNYLKEMIEIRDILKSVLKANSLEELENIDLKKYKI